MKLPTKIFRLIDGETIIADYKENDGIYDLENPMTMSISLDDNGKPFMTFHPWMSPSLVNSMHTSIKETMIMGTWSPLEYITEMYHSVVEEFYEELAKMKKSGLKKDTKTITDTTTGTKVSRNNKRLN